MTKLPLDEQLITDYLLGALPENETEQLDEMSLTDDDFADRLNAVENDLVDAYVRGELSEDTLARFESQYLASPKRREKVSFAQTLLNIVDKSTIAQIEEARQKPGWSSFFAVPRLSLQWGFAAVALVLLATGGYLMFENMRLSNQISQTQAERAALEQRELELRRRLAQQHSSDNETMKELARVRDRLAQVEQLAASQQREVKLIAFNLSPQTRGIGKIPLLAVPAGTDYVALSLELEANDFSAYQVALKNPATGKILWLSGKLKAVDTNRSVQFGLPANLLHSQNYVLELSGISPSGGAEIVSSYPFRVTVTVDPYAGTSLSDTRSFQFFNQPNAKPARNHCARTTHRR